MNNFKKLTTMFVAAAAIQGFTIASASASADLMAMLDADQDGFISLKEAVGDAELLKNFGLIDTDEDGKISLDELTATDIYGEDDNSL